MFLIIYRLIQDYLISPYLLNKTVKMPPLMIIFGISAGGQIAGVGGMFLSVPLLAIARLLLYEYGKRVAATQMNVAHLTLEAIPTAYRGPNSKVR